MHRVDQLGQERRKYIRLDSVFPVQFRLISLDGKSFLCEWQQGFTNNVGKGGICLSVNNLSPQIAKLLKGQEIKLSLDIEIPLTKKPMHALTRVSWVKEDFAIPDKYLIGLNYEQVDPLQNNKIIRYAWTKKLFVPTLLSAILIMGLVLAINNAINMQLIRRNKALVEQLVRITQESSLVKQKITEVAKDREDLEKRIQALQLRIKTLEDEKIKIGTERKLELDREAKRIGELNSLIEELAREKDSLKEQLVAIQRKENTIARELVSLDKKKLTLEKANLDKMYQWLKVHQNPRTGLVMSFEGDSDIANWAFTYDQALVIQAYTFFSDYERAKKILDYFNRKAKSKNGEFFNAYYVIDGSPAEYVVHSGPNIWLGIAIMQYSKKTKDPTYINLAEEIAQGIIDLQNKDAQGGLRGGPDVQWYSTEHNLDAYAFFGMLYKVTGKPHYKEQAKRVLHWLVEHAYDKQDIPIKRGKGDSTIATDTYAWSIAAIGPEKLVELGMNPDRIVEFAEENCRVEVSYSRPEGGALKIRGFDFAPQRHLARGGVVSSEWTAQMILAFKIMADFYHKKGATDKARSFSLKADEYLSELGNMIISSPSPSGQGESCLPYATQDFVDTGHGWFSPKGKSTGSLAATTYALFAYYNYNPLELREWNAK